MAKKVEVQDVDRWSDMRLFFRERLNNFMLWTARETATTDSLHGDGLFPIAKSVNGKVVAGTGKTVKVMDYLGLINGYKVFLGAARVFDQHKFQTLTITKTGEFFVGLALTGDIVETSVDDPEEQAAQMEEFVRCGGKLPKHGPASVVQIDASEVTYNGDIPECEGKIILAKMNVPGGTTQITEAMIDNSVKDYLVDIDSLRRDMNEKFDEVRRELHQEIVDQVAALKVEIAAGDAGVLAELNSKIDTINGQIEDLDVEISEIKANLEDLAEYISAEIAPRIDEVSAALAQAVADLIDLIENETSLLNDKIEEAEGKLGLLQTEVEAPETGLIDRVTALEEEPSIPEGLLERIDDLEARIEELEQGGGPSGPVYVNHLIGADDLDESSDYEVAGDGGWILPIDVAAQHPIQDTFDSGAEKESVNLDKWIPVGTPYEQNGKCVLSHACSIKSVVDTVRRSNISLDLTQINASGTSEGLYIYTRWNDAGYYEFRFMTGISGTKVLYVKKYKVGTGYVWQTTGTLPTIPVGTTVNIKINTYEVMGGDRVIVKINDSEVFNQVDANYGGYVQGAGQLYIYAYNVTVADPYKIDNVDVEDIEIGSVYEASGTILTKKLESVAPIEKAFLQGSVTIPENTSLTYEVSLNGGADWQEVELSELVNGLSSPWNGVSDDYRVRVTLATTDTDVTPKISILRAISQL